MAENPPVESEDDASLGHASDLNVEVGVRQMVKHSTASRGLLLLRPALLGLGLRFLSTSLRGPQSDLLQVAGLPHDCSARHDPALVRSPLVTRAEGSPLRDQCVHGENADERPEYRGLGSFGAPDPGDAPALVVVGSPHLSLITTALVCLLPPTQSFPWDHSRKSAGNGFVD